MFPSIPVKRRGKCPDCASAIETTMTLAEVRAERKNPTLVEFCSPCGAYVLPVWEEIMEAPSVTKIFLRGIDNSYIDLGLGKGMTISFDPGESLKP